MSAYQVSNAVIDQVVGILCVDCFMSEEYLQKLGQDLAEMNARAVSSCYSGQKADVVYEHTYWHINYHATQTDMKVMCGALKTLRCFLYQCSEGDVPEEALYKRVASAIEIYSQRIIECLPEYDAANWGPQ